MAANHRTEWVIGLGANLGSALETLSAAAERIAAFAWVRSHSRVFRSPPHGYLGQPHFVNAAILVEYEGLGPALMERLLGVERTMGRVRRRRWGPRVLDLDVLWGNELASERRDLRIPHPRLLQRAFALVPLCEVAPHATDPRSGRPYTRFLPDVAGQRLMAIECPAPFRTPKSATRSGTSFDVL